MILDNDVELVEGSPIAHIRSIKALVVSDLHLGYEGVMAKKGVFIPKVNLKKIIEMLSSALESTKAEKIIVVGDIKNEFSGVEQDEFNELLEFIDFAKQKKAQLVLVKGNHDNFVERYREPFKLNVASEEAVIGGYMFFHGERLPNHFGKEVKFVIMGHEHPSIGITDSVGRRQKLKCFIYGKYRHARLLVLPAMNFFATGTDVNLAPRSDLLSPIFRESDINRMHAVAIGYGSTIDFGAVGKLRNL